MALFSKRPLAVACVLLILAVILAFFLPLFWCGVLAVAMGVLFAVLLFLMLWRRYCYSLLCLLLICLFISVAFLRTGLYLRQMPQLTARFGESVNATLWVEEVRHSNTYGAELTVRIMALNDEEVSARAVLALDHASPLYVGDVISGTFTVQPLSFENYYATQQYQYMADGCLIMLIGTADQPPILEKSGTKTLSTVFADWRLYLTARITNAVNGESGKLLAAMLLGAKEVLPEAVTRDFGRAGVAHLLALSGLHIGILALLADRLLRLLAVGKRVRIVLTLLFLCVYFLMTGMAFSTLRALLMISAVYLAFLYQARADTITSLCVAAALIVCVQPYAVFSVSFQMTVLATLGIFAYSAIGAGAARRMGGQQGMRGILSRAGRGAMLSMCVSLSAGFAVLPIQWYTFGTLSAMTPLANLLLVPLAAPLLLLGLATICFFPSGAFAALAAGLGNVMLRLTAYFASFDALFSLKYDFVPYLLWPLCALSILLLLVDLKKRRWLVGLPIVAFVLCFAVGVSITHGIQADKIEVTYRATGNQEGIVCTSAGRSLLIDLSGGSYTQLNEDWRLVSEDGCTEIDVLCLTHYHRAVKSGFARLSARVNVHRLWVPMPADAEDAEILGALYQSARAAGVEVVLYAYHEPLQIFGDGELTISAPLYETRSGEPAFSLTLTNGETSVYYESAAYGEYCRHVGYAPSAAMASLYIVGAHGPVPYERIHPSILESTTVILPTDTVIVQFLPQQTHAYVIKPQNYTTVLQ